MADFPKNGYCPVCGEARTKAQVNNLRLLSLCHFKCLQEVAAVGLEELDSNYGGYCEVCGVDASGEHEEGCVNG